MGKTRANKILVTYASRGGSTKGVAEAVGSTLAAHGLEVDILPMSTVSDLSPYRAVVAGSSIRRDQWLPEAKQFIERHQAELNQKPFAAFLVCLALAVKNPERREQAERTAATRLQPIRKLVKPVSEGLFAGVLDLSKIPEVGYRLAFRLVIATGLWAEGDYRDWDAIHRWANALPAKLLA